MTYRAESHRAKLLDAQLWRLVGWLHVQILIRERLAQVLVQARLGFLRHVLQIRSARLARAARL